MADKNFGFDEPPPHGITRYVVWSLLASLAVGIFLYADGSFDDVDQYIDDMIEQTTNGSAPTADNG